MQKVEPFDIGDVHLGRRFTNGVPLERRGHREEMVKRDFEKRVSTYTGPLLVQTGDLFDAFTVDESVVLFAARVVRRAATANPGTTYVFYSGNHDASKDANKASSFDVFKELLQDLRNVDVLKYPGIVMLNPGTPEEQRFGFAPWHPFKSAQQVVEELWNYSRPNGGFDMLDCVYGHWDVEGYGSEDHEHNMVPTKTLSNITKLVKTGHIHKPTEFERDGVKVIVVGSMQPYAHGEDPATTWYKTTTYQDYINYGQTEKDWCLNLNLRILVREGEHPDPINCLSFITKQVVDKPGQDEAPDLDVQIADFNMDALFAEALKERGVSTFVSELVSAKFKELRNTGA